MSEIWLNVPMEPPSGNHYKKPRVVAGRLSWYLTAETKAWYAAVAVMARGLSVEGKAHLVEYTVFMGAGTRLDVDNAAKVVLDGLVKAGVLRSDATVTDMVARKRRDRANPRTEILVREL